MNNRIFDLFDLDIQDWDEVSPYELISNPALLSEKSILKAGARALKYSRAGKTNLYDEIGFRFSAATPLKGLIPLKTIAETRLNKESEQSKYINTELEELIEQQQKLRHRPLELPANAHFKYRVHLNTIDFILISESSSENIGDNVWSFPLTTPPSALLNQGVEDRDLPHLLTQEVSVEIPCCFWVPLITLIEAGQFQRMQNWEHKLSKKTASGCFYCFVSHRWLSKSHPDPNGVHARLLSWQIFSHLCEAVQVAHMRGLDKPRKFNTYFGFAVGIQGSNLAESLLVNVLRPNMDSELIEEAANEVSSIESLLDDYGMVASSDEKAMQNLLDILQSKPVMSKLMNRIFLWYDYSCMPQFPRTPSEETLFQEGLKYLNAFQALGRSLILLDDVEEYMSRAWCTLEAIVADTQLQSLDLMLGSQRKIASNGTVENFFLEVLEDRPHIVWRALLDTELFGLQTSSDCMVRLGLKATDEQDLPFIYQRLHDLKAPRKIHVDDSELLTGVFPLPIVNQGLSVLWAKDSIRSVLENREHLSNQHTLDWTDALNLQICWAPEDGDDVDKTPPFYQFKLESKYDHSNEKLLRCHVAIIASCEGEAVMLSNWLHKNRGDLESLINASIVSSSWLASDISPVGQFVYGKLTAVAVDADIWVILTLSMRFTHCTMVGFLIDLLQHAGRKTITFSIDKSINNILMLPSATQKTVNDRKHSQFMTIELTETEFPIHPGGLFRAAVMQYLIQS